jgi:AbrB family looped-hinge helix DNA binding protein
MAGTRRLVRIQANGHVTVPAEIRRKHNLKKGDVVMVQDTDQGVLITSQATAPETLTRRHGISLADLFDMDVEMVSGPKPIAIPEPSPEENARRKRLVAKILANREQRDVRPLKAADLVHTAREAEGASYDPGA